MVSSIYIQFARAISLAIYNKGCIRTVYSSVFDGIRTAADVHLATVGQNDVILTLCFHCDASGVIDGAVHHIPAWGEVNSAVVTRLLVACEHGHVVRGLRLAVLVDIAHPINGLRPRRRREHDEHQG